MIFIGTDEHIVDLDLMLLSIFPGAIQFQDFKGNVRTVLIDFAWSLWPSNLSNYGTRMLIES